MKNNFYEIFQNEESDQKLRVNVIGDEIEFLAKK